MLPTAFEVTDRLSSPYRSVCYLQVTYPDGTAARASGVVVGPNDILTALHVVYEAGHGGWATSVTVVPAADTRPWSAPLGQFTDMGTLVGRAPNWDLNGDGMLTQSESAGDLALIGMKSRIGDITGWLPVAQLPNDFSGVMVGYPAAGDGMIAESIYADASTAYTVYDIADCLGAGASGGPLLFSAGGVTSVAGVLSSGNADNTQSTYAGLFGDTWGWLQNALAANDYLIGGTPASTSTGMVFTGTAGNDAWSGGAGWDTFSGWAGNDTIDGGGGIDTAFYSGGRAGYAISVSGGTVTVADSLPTRDGTDTLVNVERVRFTDAAVAFDVEGNGGTAYRLYQAAFDRAPDLPGLGFQITELDNGHTITQLANNFLVSPEFQRTYGALDDTQFVMQLYRNVLDREADAGGLQFHLDDMHINGATRANVLAHFSESPENKALVIAIGHIDQGMLYTL